MQPECESDDVALQKKKTILIVKKRRRIKPAVQTRANNALLPRSTAVAAAATLQAQHQQENEASKLKEEESARDEEFFWEENDQVEQDVLLCDTLQWIHSCQTAAVTPATSSTQQQEQQQRCLVIPLSTRTTDIRGILECTLYKGGIDQNVVSRQVAELLQTNQLRKLSPPQSSSRAGTANSNVPPPSVYIKIQDYIRGVWDAHQQYCGGDNPAETSCETLPFDERTAVVDWFIHHLEHWTKTGDRIAKSELELVWKKKGAKFSKVPNLDAILEHLVHIKVLLPCYSESSFQLWLPSWPLVLRAWNKVGNSLWIQLQRSQYKERSMTSLVSRNCRNSPIPISLLVEYLESIHKVRRMKKPSDEFVKLVALNRT